MKQSKSKLPWWSVALALIFVCLVTVMLYRTPKTFLKGVDPAEIARVEVFSGSTGQSAALTEAEDIASLVRSLQSQTMHRSGISLGRMGYSYRLTFFAASDQTVEEFYLNSDTIIRRDPFFYVCGGGLGYELVENLF